MTTNCVCPICGVFTPDNGSNTLQANNTINTASDAVVTASTVIGTVAAGTVIVTTGANFAVGQFIVIPTRKETLQVASISTNTLTVTRGAKGTTPSAAIAIGDVILSARDVNGDPPHCPICGSAMKLVDPAVVTTKTAVAIGSQHPLEIRASYQTNAWLGVPTAGTAGAEGTSTTYAVSAFATNTVGLHATPNAAGVVNRGDQTVTAPTVNTVVGP